MSILIVYAAGFLLLGVLALVFYLLSVRSRQAYTCSQCGEQLQTEHLNASHCNMCGAPLNRANRE